MTRRPPAKRTAQHRPAQRKRRFRHDDHVAVDLFCVDDKTEILTGDGWKRYDELAVGDLALTIRPDGAAAEWQHVQAVNVFPEQRRKMHSIEGRGISALTTDNHRWLVRHRTKTYLGGGRQNRRYGKGPDRFEFRRSDQLTVDDVVPMAARVNNLPDRASVPDELVELVAWYWTEGTDRPSGRIHIAQSHAVNPQHVAAIRSALERLYGPEREPHKRPGGPLWRITRSRDDLTIFGLNAQAAAPIRAAAPGKVPSVRWLRLLTQTQLDLFIARSMDADGHERRRGSCSRIEAVLSQNDEARADAFQIACLLAGRPASKKVYRSTYRHAGVERPNVMYAVNVLNREYVKPLRQKAVDWVNHEGIVWCPTTPNGTWLARRNGTCYFTGNSGFGGLTQGIRRAGFTTIMAANHNAYKVEVHEANHPEAEHWIADLVDPESSDYHSARDLPPADLLVAGVSCVNHSQANTQKAYAQGISLFDLDDPEYEARVTRSERDRATANCVLHYAAQHHPRLILVECTTELQSWGPALPGKPKVGDGTTYRWWLKQFDVLGYKHRVLYLNSMFFGVPQSRDRLYVAFWDRKLPTPDLDHRPAAWCGRCDEVVESVWTWKTGVPPTGSVRYGKQYRYTCPRCRGEVIPVATPSIHAIDLTNLGTRIGDREKPLAPATMARAERCRQRFAEFPAVLMPAKAVHGSERHPWQPLATQTSQQETAVLSTGAVFAAHRHNGDGKNFAQPMDTVTSTHEKAILSTGAIMQMANSFEHPGSQCRSRGLGQPLWTQPATNSTGVLTPPVAMAIDNFQGAPRGMDEPLPTQGGSETLGLLSGVVPFRKNTTPTTHAEPMPTVTSDQIPGLLTAAGFIKNNGSIDEASYRAHPVSSPFGTFTAEASQSLLFSGWYKQNGSTGSETAAHPVTDPLGTLTAEWRAALADLALEDCYFRMMGPHEVGRGCGFDVDFADHQGTFIVWGSARNQTDGFGNAVSPAVGEWIGLRLRAVLHGEVAA